MDIREKLVHALTQYDIKESKKEYYNHYALAQYLGRLDDIMKDIESGATPRQAILAAFTGRLANACLKAIGEKKENTDKLYNDWFYVPASKKTE